MSFTRCISRNSSLLTPPILIQRSFYNTTASGQHEKLQGKRDDITLQGKRDDLTVLIQKLYIHSLNDWYFIPSSYVKLVAPELMKQYKTVEELVKVNYPTHSWSHVKFQTAVQRIKYSTPQLFLERVVRAIFPEEIVERNVRSKHGIKSDKGVNLELDIHLPNLKIAFEYQDPHHFFDISGYSSRTLSEHKERDRLKTERAEKNGITLISVPFWWQGEKERLIATIRQKRPELFPEDAFSLPLSSTPPQDIQDKYTTDIPELGQPTLALQMPRAHEFDPSGLLMFEKYDGMRAVWQPNLRTFYSRFGSVINLPNYLLDSMPNVWLDGELWFGHGKGSRYEAIKMVRAAPHMVQWDKVKYMVFDLPRPDSFLSNPYLERFKVLQSVFEKHGGNSFLELAQFTKCSDQKDLETKFFSVRNMGGEGVILRDPNSPYVRGYTRYLYKHKGYSDSEALVLQKIGDGRFLCQIDKRTLNYGKKSEDSENLVNMEMTIAKESEINHSSDGHGIPLVDIEPGVFVSFKYSGFSLNNMPFNPQIFTIRNDLNSWEQVLSGKRQYTQGTEDRIWKPRVGCDWNNKLERRKFMINFASVMNFDPLEPSNWYTITQSSIIDKGGKALLHKYDNSHIKAIIDIFPEVTFQLEKFSSVSRNHWQSKENRRHLFETIAQQKGFDPLVPSHWYPISKADLLQFKGTRRIISYYKESFPLALVDLFPEVKFDLGLFISNSRRLQQPESRRSFFDEIAKTMGFNPAVATNWYKIKLKDILQFKGAGTILTTQGSFGKALMVTYPDIGLQLNKFKL